MERAQPAGIASPLKTTREGTPLPHSCHTHACIASYFLLRPGIVHTIQRDGHTRKQTKEITMPLRTRPLTLGLPLALGACSEVASKEPEVRTVRTVVAHPKPNEDDRRAVGEV